MSSRVINKNKKPLVKVRSFTESFLLLSPLFFIVMILPLIVKMKIYNPNLSNFNWFSQSTEAYDFFLYYKQWFFVSTCGIILIVLIIKAVIDKNSIKYSKLFLPLIVYSILTLVSTLVSEHLSFGISGVYEQFENIFSLLGYILIAYYSFLIIRTEVELKMLINAIAIGALLIGVIGSFQAFGFDLYKSDFGKSMMVPNGFNTDKLNMVFGKGRAYASLYNPNYVGVYTSIMIPLFTAMLLFSKKIYEYILYSLVVITSIISLFGSQSKAGLISLAIVGLVALIMLRKLLLAKIKIILPVVAVLIVSFLIVNSYNGNSYINAIKGIFHSDERTTPLLTSINTYNDHIEIIYKDNLLKAQMNDTNDVLLSDSDGNVVQYLYVDQIDDGSSIYQIQDVRFSDLILFNHADQIVDFSFYINDTYWSFSTTAVPGTYSYYNRYGRFSPIKTADSGLFDGNESFATNRGYIWSRTFPLLKDSLILGAGAESFIFAFPQYDYVSFQNYGYSASLITKPHNLYLQIGVQSGVIALLAYLAFFIMYLVQSFRLYFSNSFTKISSCIGLAVLLSMISYLISSLSNDSNISTSPVVWAILGVGIAANNIVRIKNNNE